MTKAHFLGILGVKLCLVGCNRTVGQFLIPQNFNSFFSLSQFSQYVVNLKFGEQLTLQERFK